MKIVTIVGARPQFVKAAMVSRAIARHNAAVNRPGPSIDEIIVHTGQHYDDNMSRIFFDQMQIPRPKFNLAVGSGRHGETTGKMLADIEGVLCDELPDWVLVYGDTNSTLAGALAAAKLHVPVAHVEAGLRSFNRRMPEEINRVLTDHLSDLLFCPGATAVAQLAAEGIVAGVHAVGDVMHEALRHAVALAERKTNVLERLGLAPNGYALATLHRAENVDDPARLVRLLAALREVARRQPVVFPVHPRTRRRLAEGGAEATAGLRLLEPQGYLDMVRLEAGAAVVLTDSGGVQKEAFWLQVPCITLREETEWVETVQAGWNHVAGTDPVRIAQLAATVSRPSSWTDVYQGAGSVARLVRILEAHA